MKRLNITLLLFTILFSIELNSQVDDSTKQATFYVGGYVGYLLNSHSADFNKIEGYDNCCPQFTDGTGSGLGIGLLFEYPLTDVFRINTRFGFANMSGELKKTEKIGNTEVRPGVGFGDGDISDAVSEYSIKGNLQVITLAPGVSYYPIENLNLSAGIRLGFFNNTTFDQSEKLITPSNVVFDGTGTRARNEARNQELPNTNPLQIHGFIGAGYDFPIFKDAFLTPELGYFLAFNNVTTDNWKVNQLHLGASVKFPMYKPDEKVQHKELRIIRDTVTNMVAGLKEPSIKLLKTKSSVSYEYPDKNTEIEITQQYESYERNLPRAAEITAELNITGINRDGSRQINPAIVIEEIETEEGFPLLPYVFFKENSADLSLTSMKRLSNDEVNSFKPDELPWETLDIYANLLNIIGYRLKNSGSSITLTGTNKNLDAEKDNTKLSGDRAEAVKNYLVDVWKIPENRIKIQSRNLPSKPSNSDRPEGREENQRVEISSPDIAITAPLNLKDIVRTANPPKIELLPKLWSELGMDKWDLEISQKGKTLREFTGTGEGTTHLWDVEEEPIPSLEDPIDVKLTYSDKAGTKGELEKSLKVSQLTIRKKRSELKDDKRIERFSLILFDYDKAELTNAQKRILEDVKDKIKPNSKVIISGYADKTGDENYNKELAARRNAEVQKVLKVDDSRLVTMNIGSNELLYDNNSPEGRSYCRTVKVLVETPIND